MDGGGSGRANLTESTRTGASSPINRVMWVNSWMDDASEAHVVSTTSNNPW